MKQDGVMKILIINSYNLDGFQLYKQFIILNRSRNLYRVSREGKERLEK